MGDSAAKLCCKSNSENSIGLTVNIANAFQTGGKKDSALVVSFVLSILQLPTQTGINTNNSELLEDCNPSVRHIYTYALLFFFQCEVIYALYLLHIQYLHRGEYLSIDLSPSLPCFRMVLYLAWFYIFAF